MQWYVRDLYRHAANLPVWLRMQNQKLCHWLQHGVPAQELRYSLVYLIHQLLQDPQDVLGAPAADLPPTLYDFYLVALYRLHYLSSRLHEFPKRNHNNQSVAPKLDSISNTEGGLQTCPNALPSQAWLCCDCGRKTIIWDLFFQPGPVPLDFAKSSFANRKFICWAYSLWDMECQVWPLPQNGPKRLPETWILIIFTVPFWGVV